MEHIHGIDVSWMSHGSKEKGAKQMPRRRNTIQTQALPTPFDSSPASPRAASPISTSLDNPSPITECRPQHGGTTKLQRRSSWFSNISSKFSSSPSSSPPPTTNTASKPKQAEPPIPRANPSKNAVLQHAAKYDGDGPYIPAPPKSSPQAGFFQVLRRLSTSSGNLSPMTKGNHGLVERRVLNVDQHRQRCALPELKAAKLRRVAFCVDVEIAPMPKYADQAPVVKKAAPDSEQKRKDAEKGEGDALKSAKLSLPPDVSNESQPSFAQTATPPSAVAPPLPLPPASPVLTATVPIPAAIPTIPETVLTTTQTQEDALGTSPSATLDGKAAGDSTRKKEKKKKSEEERKARKEKKRRLAEANGTIPMELYYDSDDSEVGAAAPPTTPRRQLMPTVNPVRIYRRCCQLRETPILKNIVDKLSEPNAYSSDVGVVAKLDLTGYWMQLADLTTLSDFFAIVPIRELVLDNCGLTDEGLRAVLASLLAAKSPRRVHHHHHHHHHHHLRQDPNPCDSEEKIPAPALSFSGTTHQGGFVERLVLKNNQIGAEGWKHLALFVYMCRSLKALDLSKIAIPQPPQSSSQAQLAPLEATKSGSSSSSSTARQTARHSQSVAQLLAKAIGERLGGPTLELLNFGDTGIKAETVGILIDGIVKCGTKRLGIANNDLDDASLAHVARYIASGKCESLDLGGNDLRDRLDTVADAIGATEALWALSIADCNLKPNSLCKLLPQLTKLHNFRFLDLSHNHDLFDCNPSATALLRRFLPQMDSLKRVHLANVDMNAEQAIAIAEIIPEIKELAHINILHNAQLSKLADARTEESQEQACALYASLLAATRISPSIIAVDIETPTLESTEIVRGMAKQVLAYCLRNVDRVTSRNAETIDGDALALPRTESSGDSEDSKTPTPRREIEYPKVIQHLVGFDASLLDEVDDNGVAPDDDYVLGGTGVAQALECCLKNRGTESERPSDELALEDDGSATSATAVKVPGTSKAKDMSKHLLLSARKIRLRLQPALREAKVVSGEHTTTYQRLLFLDQTLDGIIKRFENEFPETRVSIDGSMSLSLPIRVESNRQHTPSLHSSNGGEPDISGLMIADGDNEGEMENENETDIRPSGLARSGSTVSLSSKGLTNEEGRALRAGHRFRSGWFKHYSLLSGREDIGPDPALCQMLDELIHEVNDADLNQKVAEKGIVRVFNEDRPEILEIIKAQDPEHWERFVESQQKARANLKIELDDGRNASMKLADASLDEEAIEDDDDDDDDDALTF
ncbi:cell wall biogenesis protein [Grosmannia clavigera kw1407]|uniref:Cell wall biogenesis protein n=1 Tax=Grosmannia clavigera (strain kw1407 / UAMH 11150) TaxID=655863 RepID=F0XC12_GROCL|nr:cell wall biogenesis protein [Grosmannia clavigera kw1407]EFX04689.1 cell wall biogenesis protein [Grosmannia clavigera kw1407]